VAGVTTGQIVTVIGKMEWGEQAVTAKRHNGEARLLLDEHSALACLVMSLHLGAGSTWTRAVSLGMMGVVEEWSEGARWVFPRCR
jgi:hypothetical protein